MSDLSRASPMRPLRERPFFLLLAVMLVFVVVYPVLHESVGSQTLFDAFRTAVLVAALRVIFAGRRRVAAGAALAAVLVPAIWIGHAFPGAVPLPVVFALHVLGLAFFGLAVASILWTVYQSSAVSADGVAGALCAYLLLGVVFSHGYWLIEAAAPGSFRGIGESEAELADPRHSQIALQYFSFVTLASVGANDVTPVRAAARGLTVLEAICGQFFVAVLIADLIGKKLAGPREGSAGANTDPR
jgi:voltage-gated potassium channel